MLVLLTFFHRCNKTRGWVSGRFRVIGYPKPRHTFSHDTNTDTRYLKLRIPDTRNRYLELWYPETKVLRKKNQIDRILFIKFVIQNTISTFLTESDHLLQLI